MRRRLRSAVIIAILITIAIVALAADAPWRETLLVLGGRAVVLVSAIAALAYVVLRTSDIVPPDGTALGRPTAEPPTSAEISDAYVKVTEMYSVETIDSFAKMLTDLPRYLGRINEEGASTDVPLLCITTHQLYQVENLPTGTQPPVLLIPVITAEKGTLLDGFVLTDATGARVPTIPYNQVRGLIALTLEALLLRTIPFESGLPQAMQASEYDNKKAVLANLVMAVCSPGPYRKQSTDRQKQIKTAIDSIDGLRIIEEWKGRLKRFCWHLVDHYIIVGEVVPPEGKQLILSYSHKVPLEGLARPRERWRGRFGLTPAVIDVPLNWYALQVQAYHLQVVPDAGQYVFDHHIERLRTRHRLVQKDLRTDDFKPYVRLYHQEGRPHAHLYIRRQGVSGPTATDRLKSVVEFREIPPGALGGAAIVSVASALLISFFALTHLGLDYDPSAPDRDGITAASLTSDVPAFLLTLPAFTAALIGSWTELSRVRRASLTTYLALGGTMVLSLASALYFLYDGLRKLETEFVANLPGGIHVTTEVGWLVLMVLSVTLSAFLLREWISQSRYYFLLVQKRMEKART